MGPILEEHEVTTAKIAEVFQNAFMKAELDEDGDCRVESDEGFRIYVTANENIKMLVVRLYFGLREFAPMEDKLDLVNRLNNELIFARFAVAREDALCIDYFLSYEQGISVYQVVRSLKWLSRIVASSLSEYDTKDVVG